MVKLLKEAYMERFLILDGSCICVYYRAGVA